MIGVLLVTHGNFSEAIIKSMELVFGRQEKLEALTLNHGDDVEELTRQVKERAKELDDGEGVLVLVDLLGGSPCNVTAFILTLFIRPQQPGFDSHGHRIKKSADSVKEVAAEAKEDAPAVA